MTTATTPQAGAQAAQTAQAAPAPRPPRRPCPDPAAALMALLRSQATAGPLDPTRDHVVSDYTDADLERIDRAAQLVVAAREIHPPAIARISTVRHAIAQTLTARRQSAQDAARQPSAPTPQPSAPSAPDAGQDGGSRVPRTPPPPPTYPPAGRAIPTPSAPDPRALAEMF